MPEALDHFLQVGSQLDTEILGAPNGVFPIRSPMFLAQFVTPLLNGLQLVQGACQFRLLRRAFGLKGIDAGLSGIEGRIV